ncbi:YeeE/YedE family protein [Diaphorobacter sp. HDW4A]|uniref:YeeE/YedE family protein n=1 Tax=Diaphorobacter sp. HDW4A TaxID=2714924 RepID=UPI0014079211|nr:YeeE/YedE family protein [Diaphorobacter sp. HDW4A]QIL81191.1 YeeE/YedE family protein [Diaphorobacter sp. HDW4A]
MDASSNSTLLWAGFALGCAFGAAARLSRFCLLRGLREWLTPTAPQARRHGAPALQAFALALAIALLATQWLAQAGQIDLGTAQTVRGNISVVGMLIGGLLFGIGMTLARACGARALVLLAGGNLRALITLLCMAMAAQATLTGVLFPVRQWLQGFGLVTLPHATLPALLQQGAGLPSMAALIVAVGLPVAALLAYALWQPALRRSAAQLVGAIVIGALVAAGWWITGHVGIDPFEPVPLTSLSFVGPVAEALLYLQLAVGRTLNIGPAIVVGTLCGAAAMALVTRTARWEGFDSPARFAASAIGGLLMGLGGVLAVGCTIGQGLSGLSTLAIASLPAVFGIAAGAVLTIQIQSTIFHTQPEGLPA